MNKQPKIRDVCEILPRKPEIQIHGIYIAKGILQPTIKSQHIAGGPEDIEILKLWNSFKRNFSKDEVKRWQVVRDLCLMTIYSLLTDYPSPSRS